MKLQQLRYAVEVWRHNLNVSDAAAALFTSQPGISKQIRLLEEELGVQLFVRSGKRMVAVTPAGESVLSAAAQVLRDVQNIKSMGSDFVNSVSGSLTLAATPTQLRFRLPESLRALKSAYPDLSLRLKCAPAASVLRMVANGEADLGLAHDAAEADEGGNQLRRLPCGRWQYGLLLPQAHELAARTDFGLRELSSHPLIRYDCPDTGSSFARAFARIKPLRPQFVLDAADAESAADYVRIGLGLALMDYRAALSVAGHDLAAVDVSALFEPAEDCFVIRQDTLLRPYHYDLFRTHCPKLDRSRIGQLLTAPAVEDFSI